MIKILNYISNGGLVLSILGFVAVLVDFQPMYGEKFSYNYVFACALISIASTSILKLLIDEARYVSEHK